MFGDYKILQKNLALITCLMVEGMVNPEYILRAIFILMGALSGMKVSCDKWYRSSRRKGRLAASENIWRILTE